MKIKSFIILTFFSTFTFGLTPYQEQPRDYCPESNLNLVPNSFLCGVNPITYREKSLLPTPQWMKNRVAKELEPFLKNGISQKALNSTFERLNSYSHLSHNFFRVRVLDERIYIMGNDPFGMCQLFTTLAKLSDCTGTHDLPYLDMIFNCEDGIWLADHTYGYWITENETDQAPIATFAAHADAPYGISVIDGYSLQNWEKLSQEIIDANNHYPWSIKQPKGFWRGLPSDFNDNNWPLSATADLGSYSPRYILAKYGHDCPSLLNVGFTNTQGLPTSTQERLKNFLKKDCDPKEHLNYAFLPVLDGKSSPFLEYLWKLASNSTVLKTISKHSQWFYDALEPYVHYVPLLINGQDTLDRVMWAVAHPQLCEQIANNATQFVKDQLMPVDILRYHIYLFQEYAKLQTFSREELIQLTESDPLWIRFK